jgi:hypothetical protein
MLSCAAPPASAGGSDKRFALANRMSLKIWVKKLGFWGFMFFLVKGLLWLTIPALIAVLAK